MSSDIGNKMWGGRFGSSPAAIMEEINASIDFDRRLYRQDIAASKAHVAMLGKQGIIGAAAGLAAVYGIGRFGRNAAMTCDAGAAAAQRIAPFVHGEVAAVSTHDEPRRIPELSFKDASGATKTLADWRGRASASKQPAPKRPPRC